MAPCQILKFRISGLDKSQTNPRQILDKSHTGSGKIKTKYLMRHTEAVQRKVRTNEQLILGMADDTEVTLRNLLIYKAGGHLLCHRDGEKDPVFFETLLVLQFILFGFIVLCWSRLLSLPFVWFCMVSGWSLPFSLFCVVFCIL